MLHNIVTLSRSQEDMQSKIMRVLLLVVTILGLTSAKPAIKKSGNATNIKILLDGAFKETNRMEMLKIVRDEVKLCFMEIKEPATTARLKAHYSAKDVETGVTFIQEFFGGCLAKKIFIDKLKGKLPEGKTPQAKKRFNTFSDCVKKEFKKAKGKYEELGKAVLTNKVCGRYGIKRKPPHSLKSRLATQLKTKS